jgi:hypothetical protein
LKAERWGSLLVREKCQGEKARPVTTADDNNNNNNNNKKAIELQEITLRSTAHIICKVLG